MRLILDVLRYILHVLYSQARRIFYDNHMVYCIVEERTSRTFQSSTQTLDVWCLWIAGCLRACFPQLNTCYAGKYLVCPSLTLPMWQGRWFSILLAVLSALSNWVIWLNDWTSHWNTRNTRNKAELRILFFYKHANKRHNWTEHEIKVVAPKMLKSMDFAESLVR